MKLTDEFVRQAALADSNGGRKYADGHGFYLHVSTTGKYWRLAYRVAGKPKTLALGVYPAVSLEEARRKANSARELLNTGVDPIESKKATRQVQREAAHGLRPRHPGAMLRDVVLPGLAVLRPDLIPTQGSTLCEVEFGAASRSNSGGAHAYQ